MGEPWTKVSRIAQVRLECIWLTDCVYIYMYIYIYIYINVPSFVVCCLSFVLCRVSSVVSRRSFVLKTQFGQKIDPKHERCSIRRIV